MNSSLVKNLTCVTLATGCIGTANGAVTIYEISDPNSSVKYAARAATKAEAEQVARQTPLSSVDRLQILGGCERPGWYGHVIFFPSFGKEASFAACGFKSRDELLEKLKSQLASYGAFLAVKNVVSLYDDGKPGEGNSPQEKLSRFKGFGCLAYSEYNASGKTERYWLEYQPNDRPGRFVVAPDGKSLNAVLQCHPKFAPKDAVAPELMSR